VTAPAAQKNHVDSFIGKLTLAPGEQGIGQRKLKEHGMKLPLGK